MNEEKINLGGLIHHNSKDDRFKCFDYILDYEGDLSSKGVTMFIDYKNEDYENEVIELLTEERFDCDCKFWCVVYESSIITHFKVIDESGELGYELVFEYKNSDSDKLNDKKNEILKIMNEN